MLHSAPVSHFPIRHCCGFNTRQQLNGLNSCYVTEAATLTLLKNSTKTGVMETSHPFNLKHTSMHFQKRLRICGTSANVTNLNRRQLEVGSFFFSWQRDEMCFKIFYSCEIFCGNVKLIYIVQVKILVHRVRDTGRTSYPRFTAARKKNFEIKKINGS